MDQLSFKKHNLANYVIFIILLAFNLHTNASVKGEQLYINNCVTCHGEDGEGEMPGVSDLRKNRDWIKQSDTQLLISIKNGISKPGASISMPPKGGNLDLNDSQLISIINYMRNKFSQ